MTSQKSLNNVNRNDFVRSLKESLLFPVIAFVILFFTMTAPVIGYVTDKEFLMQTVHNEISVFLPQSSSFYYMFAEIVPAGMVACGMLTAAKSFYYLLSKKQVNVFLSLGVKRNTMLKNRILSAVITLFTAVFVPMFLIYIINIVNFGVSAHLNKLFLYVTLMLFVCGLTGFAIASMMFMVSGNIFEAAFSSIALSLIPYFVFVMINNLSNGWLKGHVYTAKFTRIENAFNPWTIGTNIQNDYIGEDYTFVNVTRLLRPLIGSGEESYKIPEQYNVDMGFVLPVIGWFVVALIVIGVTFYLYNRRKAEHANSLGKFSVLRAVIGTTAFVLVAWFWVNALRAACNLFLLFLVILISTFIAYAVVQLVLTRKVKTAFKSFKWYGVLVAVAALCMITVGTGIFGTYNKLPDIKDVKSVSVSTNELEMFPHYIDTYDGNEDFVESSTDESKKMVLELFELLKNEKVVYNYQWSAGATLAIRDNDGNVMYRRFSMYSEETYRKYLELVYGSDFIDAIFRNYLVDDIPENPYDDSTGYFKKFLWAYTDSDLLLKRDTPFLNIEDIDGLGKALYKDYSAMSIEQLLKNNEKPVCVLARGYTGEVDFSGSVPVTSTNKIYSISEDGTILYDKDYNPKTDFVPTEYGLLSEYIPVYSYMTSTLEFLEKNGCITDEKQLTIKEVLYTDSFIDYNKASSDFVELNTKKNDKRAQSYSYQYPEIATESFYQGAYTAYQNEMIGYFLDETTTEYELLKKVYKDIGHPLKSVTDTEKAQEIFDNTVSRYMYLGDEGRFVYVVYEEGPIVCYYLPEANLSVIK